MAHFDVRETVVNLLGEWPKIIPGLAVAVGQFAWKRVGDRRKDSRRAELRATITQLRGFLDTRLEDSADAAAVLAQARTEYNTAVAELARLSTPRPQTARERHISLPQRWLLLYAPSSSLAWFLHGLFFVLVGVLILGLGSSISEGDADSDTLLGFGIFAVLVLIIRWGAAAADSRAPTRRAGTILTVAMYLSLAVNGFLLLGVALGDDDTPSLKNLQSDLPTAVGGTIFLAGVALVCWFIRRRLRRNLAAAPVTIPPDQTPSPL